MNMLSPAITLDAVSTNVLLAGADSPEGALTIFRAAIARGDDRPTTLLNLAIAQDRAGETVAARQQMLRVAAAHPGWDEPALRLAGSYRRDGDWPAAEAAYTLALDINPARLEALVALGAGLVTRNRAAEAVPLLGRACALNNATFEAWHAYGLALLNLGDAAAASEALAEASRLAPDRLDIAVQRVEAAFAAGAAEAELSRLEQLAETSPLDPTPLRLRAFLLEKMGRLQEGADLLEAAAAIAPDDAECAAALGRCLATLGQTAEAETALRRALTLDPELEQARSDLAAVLIRQLAFTEAETHLRALIATHGDNSMLLANLAAALSGQGQQEEAAAMARRGAAAAAPHDPKPWLTLSSLLPYAAPVEDQIAAVRACAQRFPRGERHAFTNIQDPERPLRVGLLSKALRRHPVGWLTIAGWEALDEKAFELVCLGPFSPEDALARRFRARAAAWPDVAASSDADVAALCREMQIDIVVDLGGHGESGRLGVLAHRAAPVQIKWVGSQFGTSGLPEMDWFITDRWETPRGSADLYDERLLQLPDGYICYDPPHFTPDVSPLPALSSGRITFGCFNNLAKITPEVLSTWARILAALPSAKIILKAPQLCDALLAAQVTTRLQTAGLDPQRVELRGKSNHRDHLASYADIDIVLDPFPYSGGLSTCEALWMGVPTITLPRRSFASRHTLSHQENAGLHGWAASSTSEYVALAVQRASDLDALAALRAGLRARVAASPLCDAPRFGRSLGAALRHAWRTWCEEGSPAGSGA